MPYDRQTALRYARKHWNTVCSDGYVCIKNTPHYEKIASGTPFKQEINDGGTFEETIARGDGSVISLAMLEDCSHFVSSCLGKPPATTAGGLDIGSDFPAGPYGRLSAQGLYDRLITKNLVTIVAEKKNHADAQSYLGSISPGDLIFYFDTSVAPNRYGHSAIFLGGADNDIACHTYCRCDVHNDYPQSWDSVGLRIYTFLKVK